MTTQEGGRMLESAWAELRRTVYTRRRHEPGSHPELAGAPSSGLQLPPQPIALHVRLIHPVGSEFSLLPNAFIHLEGGQSSLCPLEGLLQRGVVHGFSGVFSRIWKRGAVSYGCLKSSNPGPTSPGAGCWEYNSEQDSHSPLRGSGAHEFLGSR